MTKDGLFDLGSRLKYFRKQKGYSQTYLAEEVLGINRSTYSNYENGHRTPDITIILMIADALEIDVSELLGEKHYRKVNIKDMDTPKPTETEYKALSFYSAIEEKTYEMVEYYFYNTRFASERPVITALEFFNADKYLSEITVKTVSSAIQNFCHELNSKISTTPKTLTPKDDLPTIPFRYKRGGEINTVIYPIGKKEESEEYLEVILEDYFYKLIDIKHKKAQTIESKDERRERVIKDNEELERILERLKQEFFKKFKFDLVENDGNLPTPESLQDNKEGE